MQPDEQETSMGRSLVELTTLRSPFMPPVEVFDGELQQIEASLRPSVPEEIRKRITTTRNLVYRHPSFLPGGKALLFTIGMADTDSYDNARIGVVSLETGEKKIVLEGGASARYSPSGHLIYARGGKLLAAPFDAKKLQVTGAPFPVVDGVFMSANTGMAAFSISAGGSLVYAAGAMEGGERLPVWVDRKGAATPLPLPPRSYLHPRLSPDERQVAIEVEGASHDIYTYDLARGVMTKLSFDGSSHWPMWTPKGDQLTFRSWKTGTMTMWSMPADRSGPPMAVGLAATARTAHSVMLRERP